MKEYFIHTGTGQKGPYSIEGLKEQKINKDTPVWCEGMTDWQDAGEVEELRCLFTTTTPPPLHRPFRQSTIIPEEPEKPRNSKTMLIISGIAMIMALGGVVLFNSTNSQRDDNSTTDTTKKEKTESVTVTLDPKDDDRSGAYTGEDPYTFVEQMPEYPGGEQKMAEFLGKNIVYPQIAKESGIQGTVYISFVVTKEGKVKGAKVIRGIGGGCDQEALRVVKSMPDWEPGKQDGKAVPVQFNLPVKFTLQ
jgi:TonB family protein